MLGRRRVLHLQLVARVVEGQDAEEQGVRLVVHLHQRVDRKALGVLGDIAKALCQIDCR
jgi:hypothetical protein